MKELINSLSIFRIVVKKDSNFIILKLLGRHGNITSMFITDEEIVDFYFKELCIESLFEVINSAIPKMYSPFPNSYKYFEACSLDIRVMKTILKDFNGFDEIVWDTYAKNFEEIFVGILEDRFSVNKNGIKMFLGSSGNPKREEQIIKYVYTNADLESICEGEATMYYDTFRTLAIWKLEGLLTDEYFDEVLKGFVGYDKRRSDYNE